MSDAKSLGKERPNKIFNCFLKEIFAKFEFDYHKRKEKSLAGNKFVLMFGLVLRGLIQSLRSVQQNGNRKMSPLGN